MSLGHGAHVPPPPAGRSFFSSPPPFVGRDEELAWLARLLHEAVAGRPGVAFVYGEAGIGKTRLVREFRQEARAAGARVLYGRCQEDLELPYAPLEPLLRELGEGSAWGIAGGEPERGAARRQVTVLIMTPPPPVSRRAVPFDETRVDWIYSVRAVAPGEHTAASSRDETVIAQPHWPASAQTG